MARRYHHEPASVIRALHQERCKCAKSSSSEFHTLCSDEEPSGSVSENITDTLGRAGALKTPCVGGWQGKEGGGGVGWEASETFRVDMPDAGCQTESGLKS